MTSGAREEDVKFFRSQKSDRETDRDGMSDKDDRSKRASKHGVIWAQFRRGTGDCLRATAVERFLGEGCYGAQLRDKKD